MSVAGFYLWSIMKLVIDVKDNKVEFLLELLRSLPFVKSTAIRSEKDEVLDSVRAAVEEMKLVKDGKLKGRPVQDLLNEL